MRCARRTELDWVTTGSYCKSLTVCTALRRTTDSSRRHLAFRRRCLSHYRSTLGKAHTNALCTQPNRDRSTVQLLHKAAGDRQPFQGWPTWHRSGSRCRCQGSFPMLTRGCLRSHTAPQVWTRGHTVQRSMYFVRRLAICMHAQVSSSRLRPRTYPGHWQCQCPGFISLHQYKPVVIQRVQEHMWQLQRVQWRSGMHTGPRCRHTQCPGCNVHTFWKPSCVVCNYSISIKQGQAGARSSDLSSEQACSAAHSPSPDEVPVDGKQRLPDALTLSGVGNPDHQSTQTCGNRSQGTRLLGTGSSHCQLLLIANSGMHPCGRVQPTPYRVLSTFSFHLRHFVRQRLVRLYDVIYCPKHSFGVAVWQFIYSLFTFLSDSLVSSMSLMAFFTSASTASSLCFTKSHAGLAIITAAAPTMHTALAALAMFPILLSLDSRAGFGVQACIMCCPWLCDTAYKYSNCAFKSVHPGNGIVANSFRCTRENTITLCLVENSSNFTYPLS